MHANLFVNAVTPILLFADGFGDVKYDVGYGGGFYILADVKQLELDLKTTPVGHLIEAGVAIKEAVK